MTSNININIPGDGIPAAKAEVRQNWITTKIEIETIQNDLGSLAAVARTGALSSLTSLNANGGRLTFYLAEQDTINTDYTFIQEDSGREKIFTGSVVATFTVPGLLSGTGIVVHNIGSVSITFVANGVTLKGLRTLASDKTAAVIWLPGNIVKLIGELS